MALVVLALLAVVALSVRAHYSLGPSGVSGRGPATAVLSSIVQALLVVSVAAFELILVVAFVYAPWRRLRDAGRSGVPAARVRRRTALTLAAIPFLILVAELLLFVALVGHGTRRGASTHVGHGQLPFIRDHAFAVTVGSVTVPEATALAAAVGLVALLALVLTRARSRKAPAGDRTDSTELPRNLSLAIDQSLVELAAGTDPRQAVIAAYERMEGVLVKVGLSPLKSETPLEYLQRALTRLEASRGSLVRLTHLFEIARFSAHPISPGMRAEAETALTILRAELSR